MEKIVAIIGSGPTGLAAAAHVQGRGMTPLILEAGPAVAAAVRAWGHVRLFSPWSFNIDPAAERLLSGTEWQVPDPEAHPTGDELIENYLAPLAATSALRDRIHLNSRVIGVTRLGFDRAKTKGRAAAPFEIRVRQKDQEKSFRADAVIDASGVWASPNPAGADGLPAIGEVQASDRLAYGMPDVLGRARAQYAGRRVAVAGSGHSAIGTLLDLATLAEQAPGTQIIWLLRGADAAKSFGGGPNDALAARGDLGSAFAQLISADKLQVEPSFRISHIAREGADLRIAAGSPCCGRHVLVDELIVATGYRPDLGFLSELRLDLDPALECPRALAPMIDPNEHSCGTVRPHGALELAQPDEGFYIAGMKSYGRAPTFLMRTGYEQVRSIVAEIAGDHGAARRVELTLPETGVCSIGPSPARAKACCG
jgi:thioredoxin reductase